MINGPINTHEANPEQNAELLGTPACAASLSPKCGFQSFRSQRGEMRHASVPGWISVPGRPGYEGQGRACSD